MPRTIETLAYKFDELNDSAKQKARDWFREASAGDNQFSESVIEDVERLGAMLGITFKTRSVKLIGGATSSGPCVFWSGFSSQGDGASFEGAWSFKAGAAEAITQETNGTETELLRIAGILANAQGDCPEPISCEVSQRGHYCHEFTMHFDFNPVEIDGEESEVDSDVQENINGALRAFAKWIYRALEKESAYQDSDEVIDETIRANEYEFTEAGKII